MNEKDEREPTNMRKITLFPNRNNRTLNTHTMLRTPVI